MNCDELRQNAAAYALGALSDEEHAEFERHLAECGIDHERELFGDVASRLSDAMPAMEPPPGLRDRIMAVADADAAGGRVSGLAVAEGPDYLRPATGGMVRRVRDLGSLAYGAAAAALIVIGALAGWAIASITADDPVSLRHFHREEDGDWFRVETELGRPGMTLSVGNLDPLPAQNAYQFWAIRDEQWVPVGGFNTNPEGRWSGDFEFALKQGDSVAITIEPAEGSTTPTSEAEIQSRI